MRRVVAAGFGVGLVPRRLWGSDAGAGTLGALVAAGVALALAPLPVWVHVVCAAVVIAVSLWAPLPFLADDPDPGWVAIDEVAGTLVALVGLSGVPWVLGWLVARAADITKLPPGVGAAERLPGTWGVTTDDLVAGLYGLAAGWILTLVL